MREPTRHRTPRRRGGQCIVRSANGINYAAYHQAGYSVGLQTGQLTPKTSTEPRNPSSRCVIARRKERERLRARVQTNDAAKRVAADTNLNGQTVVDKYNFIHKYCIDCLLNRDRSHSQSILCIHIYVYR